MPLRTEKDLFALEQGPSASEDLSKKWSSGEELTPEEAAKLYVERAKSRNLVEMGKGIPGAVAGLGQQIATTGQELLPYIPRAMGLMGPSESAKAQADLAKAATEAGIVGSAGLGHLGKSAVRGYVTEPLGILQKSVQEQGLGETAKALAPVAARAVLSPSQAVSMALQGPGSLAAGVLPKYAGETAKKSLEQTREEDLEAQRRAKGEESYLKDVATAALGATPRDIHPLAPLLMGKSADKPIFEPAFAVKVGEAVAPPKELATTVQTLSLLEDPTILMGGPIRSLVTKFLPRLAEAGLETAKIAKLRKAAIARDNLLKAGELAAGNEEWVAAVREASEGLPKPPILPEGAGTAAPAGAVPPMMPPPMPGTPEAVRQAGQRFAEAAEEAAAPQAPGTSQKIAQTGAQAAETLGKKAGAVAEWMAGMAEKYEKPLSIAGALWSLAHGHGLGHATLSAMIPKFVERAGKAVAEVKTAGAALRSLAEADWNSRIPVWRQISKNMENAPAWLVKGVSAPVIGELTAGELAERSIRAASRTARAGLHGAETGLLMGLAQPQQTGEELGGQVGAGLALGTGMHMAKGAFNLPQIGAMSPEDRAIAMATDAMKQAAKDIREGSDPLAIARTSDAVMSNATLMQHLFKGVTSGGKELGVSLQDDARFQQEAPENLKGGVAYYDPAEHRIVVNVDRQDPGGRLLHEAAHPLFESMLTSKPEMLRAFQEAFTPDMLQAAREIYAANSGQSGVPMSDLGVVSELFSDVLADQLRGLDLGTSLRKQKAGAAVNQFVERDANGALTQRSAAIQAAMADPNIVSAVRSQFEALRDFRPLVDSMQERGVKLRADQAGKHPGLERGSDFVEVLPDGRVVAASPQQVAKKASSRRAETRALYPDTEPVPAGQGGTDVAVRELPSGGQAKTGTTLGEKFYRTAQTFGSGAKALARRIEQAIAAGETVSGWYQEIGEKAKGWTGSVRENLGNIEAKFKDFIPYAFEVTKQGNILVKVVSLTGLDRKAQVWAQNKGTIFNLDAWGGSVDAFKTDVQTYLKNHADGRPGSDGIGETKKNLINAFLVGQNRTFEAFNPLRAMMSPKEREGVISSYRLDRLQTVEPSSVTGYAPADYGKWLRNLSGEARSAAAENKQTYAPEAIQNQAGVREERQNRNPLWQIPGAGSGDRLLRSAEGEIAQPLTAPAEGPSRLLSGEARPKEFEEINPKDFIQIKDYDHAQQLFDRGYVLFGGEYDGFEEMPVRLNTATDIQKFDPENLVAVSPSKAMASGEALPADPLKRRKIITNNAAAEFLSLLKDGETISNEGEKYGIEFMAQPPDKNGSVYIEYLTNHSAPSGTVGRILQRIAEQYPLRLVPMGSQQEGYFKSLGFTEGPGRELVLDRRPSYSGEAFSAEEPGFYSKLERVINSEMKSASMPAAQLKAVLRNRGVKQEELKWTKVDEKIDRLAAENGGKVPKEELLSQLRGGRSMMGLQDAGLSTTWEVTTDSGSKIFYSKEEANEAREKAIQKWANSVEDAYRAKQREDGKWIVVDEYGDPARIRSDNGQTYLSARDVFADEDTAKMSIREAIEMVAGDEIGIRQWANYNTQFEEFTLPGGRNYREIALVDPEIKRWRGAGHHDFSQVGEADINRRRIAHMRVKDRVDLENRPGLFIEEIQSDRHQEGRAVGYQEDIDWSKVPVYDYKDLVSKEVFPGILHIEKHPTRYVLVSPEGRTLVGGSSLENLRNYATKNAIGTGVPDAPFRKDWPLQMFKRALQDAVESGKKWVGWIDGQTQVDRYDLGKQVDRIDYRRNGPDSYDLGVIGKDGKNVISEESVSLSRISDVVGKEIAEKIKNGEGKPGGNRMTLSDVDLKIGGEGMKGFYDRMLPKEISKYVKQWGATVEKAPVRTREDYGETVNVWKIDISPEMAESIKTEGQERYSGEAKPVTPYERNLVAMHNTTEEGVREILRLGGVPVPSVAVTKRDIPFSDFGDITLIGRRELVDPQADRRNRLFAADVYSGRQPRAEFVPTKNGPDRVLKIVDDALPEGLKLTSAETYGLLDELQASGPDNRTRVKDALAENFKIRLAFLNSEGIQVPLEKHIRIDNGYVLEKDIRNAPQLMEAVMSLPKESGYDFYSSLTEGQHARLTEAFKHEIIKKLKDTPDLAAKIIKYAVGEPVAGVNLKSLPFNLFDKLVSDVRRVAKNEVEVDLSEMNAEARKLIQEHKDAEYGVWLENLVDTLYDPNRIFRSGSKKVPYTLENLTSEMSSSKIRGEEGSGSGLGKSRGMVTPEIKSIEEAHAKKAGLAPASKVDTAKMEQDRLFFPLASELRKYAGRVSSQREIQNDLYTLVEKVMKNPKGVDRFLMQAGYTEVPSNVVAKLLELAKVTKESPTQYFEAKPQRGVALNEFVAAVVPERTSLSVIRALEKAGLKVEKYGVSSEHLEAVNRAVDATQAMFSGEAKPVDLRQAGIQMDGDISHKDPASIPLRGTFKMKSVKDKKTGEVTTKPEVKVESLPYDFLGAPLTRQILEKEQDPVAANALMDGIKTKLNTSKLKSRNELTPEESALYTKVVDAYAQKFADDYQRIANNKDVVAAKGWYKDVAKFLSGRIPDSTDRTMFLEFLGGTSPNTNVEQNFLYALDLFNRWKLGELEAYRTRFNELSVEWAQGSVVKTDGSVVTGEILERSNSGTTVKQADGNLVKVRTADTAEFRPGSEAVRKEVFSDDGKSVRPEFIREYRNALLKDYNGDFSSTTRAAVAKEIASLRENKGWSPADYLGAYLTVKRAIPARKNGGKYGVHTDRVFSILNRDWTQTTDAPKAVNFTENLGGVSTLATIDVWAARFLRRMGYDGFGTEPWRIQPMAEEGVANKDFFFGQDVFKKAGDLIKERTGESLDGDDLQAIMWFAEKRYWAEKGWSQVEDLGDFRQYLYKMHPEAEGTYKLSKVEFSGTSEDFAKTLRLSMEEARLSPKHYEKLQERATKLSDRLATSKSRLDKVLAKKTSEMKQRLDVIETSQVDANVKEARRKDVVKKYERLLMDLEKSASRSQSGVRRELEGVEQAIRTPYSQFK